MPSDTYFSAAPEWNWLVIFYFFLGGIAGGSYFLAALMDFFGDEADRPLARLGYFVAFPAVVLCAPLLIVDLTRPERFWHMLIQSERGVPIFKWWSPMSVGAWALFVIGAFTFVSFMLALAEAGVLRWRLLVRLNDLLRRGALGKVYAVGGALSALFLASYTGVLLSVTNRPIWADTRLLGLLFLTSAASTAAALLLLLGHRRRAVRVESLQALARMDEWVMLLELLVLGIVVISLGSVAQEFWSAWGVLLAAVVLVGILVPLALHLRPRLLGSLSLPMASVFVLVGGLMLRAVIVLSSEGA